MQNLQRIGILGGGQLARMLILEGHRLGLEMHVMCSSQDDPAAQVTSHVQIGSISEKNDLKRFLEKVDFVTFESEFVDTHLLAACLPTKEINVFPSLNAIEIIQDRMTQKSLLDQFKIPTAPWMPVENAADLKKAGEKFKTGFVLKKRRFGYDGYGTFVIKRLEPKHFDILKQSQTGFIAEEFIPFKRELAFSVASSKRQLELMPLVETHQVDSRCLWVKGPIKNRNLVSLRKNVLKMIKFLEYEGILAFELFETSRGLLVNELAPRVHNSGHYSQDALNLSQFELHLRAGLNLKLPKLFPLAKGFAMVNLLGERESETVKFSSTALGKLHWYGKSLIKPGRKMGHLNTLAATPEAALKLALKWRKDFIL